MKAPRRGGLAANLLALLTVYRGGAPPGALPGAPSGPAGVAAVLGAQVLPGGRPSRALAARTRHAARLYREGRASLLVPTGGLGEHPPSEAEVMARILREEGVPAEAVLLEDRALNTWDSARIVAAIARGLGAEEVLVVTDPLHCVRTVAAFEAAGIRARAEPVYSSPMWSERWSRRGQLVREGVAIVWYKLRHGDGSRSRP